MVRKATLLRISLRGLIVLFTVICLWLGKVSIDARSQKNAAARVVELGGNVNYDWEEPVFDVVTGNDIYPSGPYAPAWLRSLIGDDYFQKVVSIDCNGKKFDATLLEDLPHLRLVSLIACDIKDLSSFSLLTELQYLSVRENQIADLSPLASLHNLVMLDVSDNQIVDCAPLHDLKRLD